MLGGTVGHTQNRLVQKERLVTQLPVPVLRPVRTVCAAARREQTHCALQTESRCFFWVFSIDNKVVLQMCLKGALRAAERCGEMALVQSGLAKVYQHRSWRFFNHTWFYFMGLFASTEVFPLSHLTLR